MIATTDHIDDFATDSTTCGTSGCDDSCIGELMAEQATGEYGPDDLIDPCEVADDTLVVLRAMLGAPRVVEKIPQERAALGQKHGYELFTGTIVDVLPRNIGMPCSPKWRTDPNLDLIGPEYSNHSINDEPIETLQNKIND